MYYWFENKKMPTDLPPGSVKQEGSKYYFYRGDKKITKAEGLPHNLRGKKKNKTGIVKEDKEVVISFD